ncbi:hypothetical protein BURPS1710b_A1331 [Burkholderia pseudomallei 1710b]|uniref:Uncharacterized protein n=1 Tax=Burkholderia pseudomallei (strain 1710b) TaxID=320372 RepID=Q3JIW5_BURP1|nr:hypothetical protein BURPS1710b_A1331 [Burkholderia pseudomallei 1710b]
MRIYRKKRVFHCDGNARTADSAIIRWIDLNAL